MKKLKLKRIYAYAMVRKLKSIPPRIFPSTDEIKVTADQIIPSLKKVTAEYHQFLEESEKVNRQVRRKKLSEEEANKQLDEIRSRWDAFSDEHAEEMVEVLLESEAYTVLHNQFVRDVEKEPVWGRHWLENIEEFSEVSKAFDEADTDK